MAGGITVKGLGEVNRALRQLPAAVGKKVVRKALRAALKPMKARVQALAPVATGQTKQAAKVLSGRSRKGRITLRVVIGKGDYQGDRYYAAFQEYGWKLGSRKRGSSRPEVPGKHFMKRAFDETSEAVKADAERRIADGVEAEARRLGR